MNSGEASENDQVFTGDSSYGEYVLTGCLTVADVVAAHRLATRGRWLRVGIVLLFVGTFILYLIAIAVTSRGFAVEASNRILFVACVLFPAFLVVPIAVRRWRLHRYARERRGIFAPTHSTFSPTQIVQAREYLRTELQWGLFTRCVANETVALLAYKDGNRHLLLARRTLADPGLWHSFLEMIQTQLAKSGQPRA